MGIVQIRKQGQKKIVEVMAAYPDLVVLNNGDPTRLYIHNPNSAMHITLIINGIIHSQLP